MQPDTLELADTGILGCEGYWSHGVVGRDMRVLIRVGRDIFAVVEGVCVLASARGRADVEDAAV
jgi:hypothetical protein